MDFLALDFINTEWFIAHYHFRDVLTDPELLTDFLEKRQRTLASAPTPEIMGKLVRYRAFLSGALKELMAGRRISDETAAHLEQYLSLAPGTREARFREGKYETTFRPFEKDWNWFLAEVASSFFELSNMDTGRIRVCENPDCRWIFYDETRSRTKRCCDGTCANLVKVRRFRNRKKEEG